MSKPTYEQLENRVKELEKALGSIIDKEMDAEQRELFELSILYNIAHAVASVRDLNQLLRIVIDEVNKAMLSEGAGILLYDESRGDLYWQEVKDARDLLGPRSAELRLPIDRSIAGWVFTHGRPARVNDTAKDPRYYPEVTRKTGFQIKKVLQAPLNARDKTIGVLMIMNKIGGDFTEEDEALAGSMATIIALAIENATVYEKLKRSRENLEMLYRSSMALATTMDLDHLLEVVVAELTRAMETEAAGVVLYDEKRKDLYWREVQDEKGLINRQAANLRLPVENSISGRVYRTGEPVMLNDPSKDPLFFTEFETRSGFHVRNEIIVPLNTREGTIGVLVVMNKKRGQFSEEDIHLCSSLAGVVAMAVENATFFQELLDSYRELEDLNRAKSKILNHLSHELRTPLAIIRGTLATMERRLKERGIEGFDSALSRMNRHVQSLNRLESQVESIMMTGYTWERRMITDFLDAALTLMDVQAERTPEIDHASKVIRKWLEKTFPLRNDEPERINVRNFGLDVLNYCRGQADREQRRLTIQEDLENTAELLIPGHVLQAIMEGLIRNAIEATPDGGLVKVKGRTRDDRYIFSVKDTGIGIPEDAQERIFEGFYPVQDTDSYSTGRPYSFNAGGKGMDLLRIRMFSEIYGFKISFTSRRCNHVVQASTSICGDADHCPLCTFPQECMLNGGSEFVIDFPLAEKKSGSVPGGDGNGAG
ncbi:MAG: GAF domain-containing sensor histidine kinase [Desulfomonile sp.]|nr:GAF domain-containing sensor histidine kinase [Desulfomonile sp.]